MVVVAVVVVVVVVGLRHAVHLDGQETDANVVARRPGDGDGVLALEPVRRHAAFTRNGVPHGLPHRLLRIYRGGLDKHSHPGLGG